MIYFTIDAQDHVVIGTPGEIAADLDWRGEGSGCKGPRKRRYRQHVRQVVRQMEGGEAQSTAIRARFAEYRHFPDRPNHFRLDGELKAFVLANTAPWTGQDALSLGLPTPKRPQDVPVPVRMGLRRSKPTA